MGGQLDGIFLAGSLPHEFIILIVTLFICLWFVNKFLSLSLRRFLSRVSAERARHRCGIPVIATRCGGASCPTWQ